MKSVVAVLSSLSAIGLCATSLVAQQGARLSAEVSVGVGFGHGGEWENRELGTLNGLVAWRVARCGMAPFCLARAADCRVR